MSWLLDRVKTLVELRSQQESRLAPARLGDEGNCGREWSRIHEEKALSVRTPQVNSTT
jgi:hypothetical protein